MKIFVFTSLTVTCFLLLTCCNPVNCGKILLVIPTPLHSHQVPYRGLLRELLKRGHEVVYITAKPLNDTSIANLTEIDISATHQIFNEIDTKNILLNYQTLTTYERIGKIYQFTNIFAKIFYNHPEIKKLYATGSDAKFDLIVMESIVGFSIYALPHRLKAPFIGIQSVDFHLYHSYFLGLPIMASHHSNWELVDCSGPSLSFWDKVWNFVVHQISILQFFNYLNVQQQLVERWLGTKIPSLYDIAKNMSLFMVEYDPLIGHPKPLTPNVIIFTGLHILEKLPAIPTQVSEFLGNATNGFIYMNLGCTAKSSFLPFDTVRAMYNVFSRLPYRVLWKYEMDNIPKRNGNILISDWLPQQSILAHPNIKLFIFQGGQQSTEEAIYYSVPIVGIPIAFEQPYHIRRLQSLGAGKLLDHELINEEIFHEAIHDVLGNESYKTNMAKLSRLLKDKPYDNKEHVAWWMEYVMRNKGAPHLRFSGVDEPWYSRFDMHIIAFLSIVLFVLTVIWIIVLALGIRWLYRHRSLLSRVIKKVSSARSGLKRE